MAEDNKGKCKVCGAYIGDGPAVWIDNGKVRGWVHEKCRGEAER